MMPTVAARDAVGEGASAIRRASTDPSEVAVVVPVNVVPVPVLVLPL
jgi:hypothetical protein